MNQLKIKPNKSMIFVSRKTGERTVRSVEGKVQIDPIDLSDKTLPSGTDMITVDEAILKAKTLGLVREK